jgi:hypothetical protein
MVTPVQQVLPPQALLYVSDPGKYFNITLINRGQSVQNVYLAMELEQVTPSAGLSITTPANRQPQTPFTLTPGQPRQLTMVEMKKLFDHIPKNEINTTPGLFDNFQNGAFGLLPEGTYKIHITAYKWDLAMVNPMPLSNPSDGICMFTVCYKAQAPDFITPMADIGQLVDLSVAQVDKQNVQFTWRQPVVACNPAALQFSYNFKIVELLPDQQPDDAIQRNPDFYIVKDLLVPLVMVPANYVARMDAEKTYVAQVTARQTGTGANMLNYVMIENSGKSPFRLFRIVDKTVPPPEKKNDDKKEEELPDTGYGETGGATGNIHEYDSMYVFKRPVIREPHFEKGTSRKLFVEEDIGVEWQPAAFAGGDGTRQDTLNFSYDVELYRAKVGCNKDSLFKTKPFFTTNVKDASYTTIPWAKLEEAGVEIGNYMVLRVNPLCSNERSIRFQDGTDNITDFTIAKRLSKSYFQCSSTVEIDNVTPTTKTEKELKGQEVAIGEYMLTIDEIKKVSGKDCYKGKGHVEWRPMGFKVMIAVKFDDLQINSDNQVYGGTAVSYQDEDEKALSNSEVVDRLFSDWGVDNLIGDAEIPHAKELTEYAKSGVKSLAEELDISQYYGYIRKGKAVCNALLSGEVKDLHLPLQLPKEINKTPVDIQIVSMKFAHNYATMNVLGEFALPKSNYLKNDVLLLGAPRLCISPNSVLPESGTIALLGDFTLKDPETAFEFTFKAPEDLLQPTNGCFISWHAGELELFDVDVSMTIPGLKKVDGKGNRLDELPSLRFHSSIGGWDDWFAEAEMDGFEVEDLQDWTFYPGDKIVYDHSVYRNADEMTLPAEYDRSKADIEDEREWQGLFVKHVGVIFPKMLSVSDQKKSFEGRLRLDVEDMYFDDSGATLKIGLKNVFDVSTGKVGGWGISMDELKLEVMQSAFDKAYFSGTILTPLDGKIGYRCDMYAQGKDAEGMKDPNRSAYIFKTQQVDGLKLDFWLGELSLDKDQTYFLVEVEKEKDKEADTKVELCVGGDITINVGREQLRNLGKVGSYLDTQIPGVHIAGMRIANCERWKSQYTQNQYEAPDDGKGAGINEFFGWKSEYNVAKDKFYFSIGRWSLASEKKKMGSFDFNLTDFNFNYDEGKKKAVLTIGGQIALMEGQIAADCALDILANVDTKNYTFSLDDVKFKKASFDCEFGGVTLKGELETASGDDEGYAGMLTFALPGDFLAFEANGGYFTRKKDSEEYTWGYFLCSVQSKVGIRIDPIIITKLQGGFYFNCKAPKTVGSKPTANDAKEGVYGGMLGVGLATSGGENMLCADMDLTVVYDSRYKKNARGEWQGRLSSIIMNGTLEALKPSADEEGLVHAQCQLAYVNDKERYIELNVTASGGASLDQKMQEKLKALTGNAFKKGEAVMQKLDALTAGETENKSTQADKKEPTGEDKNFKATCGFEVSLNFKVTMNEDQPAKWHLCIGEPPYEKRCKLTLIDFQLGDKKDYFAAWAYLGATMYLCLGNELPNGGILPDPPQSVLDFLNGKDINGNKNTAGSEAKSAKQESLEKMRNIINNAAVAGGLMVGAGAEGDFGINAGIIYASGYFTLGFDLVLEKFEKGQKCQGGRDMGYNGWYGMGSAYAMLKGDLGVDVKLWFVEKRVSLISVGLGAMLQAGLPNPTWAYGKVRAHCSLLDGLISFDHTIEMKAGEVCMPDYGNPLDNIKLFASASPGYENDAKKGHNKQNRVSPYAQPKFVTNYVIGRTVRLVDEQLVQQQVQNKGAYESEARANCERIYKFELGPAGLMNVDEGHTKIMQMTTTNNTDFNCYAGALEPNTRYAMILSGYAKEWDKKKYQWVNPEIDGKRREKTETVTYYFCTGDLDPVIDKDVEIQIPRTRGTWGQVRWEDAVSPSISLNRHRTDLTSGSKYDVKWEVWKDEKLVYSCDNQVTTDGGKYEIWSPRYSLSTYIPAGVSAGNIGTNDWNWRYGWQVKCVRIEKKLQNVKMSEKDRKTSRSAKQTSGTHSAKSKSAIGVSQPTQKAKSSMAARMNEFFANQEKEEIKNKSTVTEDANKMTADAARQDGRFELWSINFGKAVNSTFANETSFYYENDCSMDGTYIAVHDFEMYTPAAIATVNKDESNQLIGGMNSTFNNLTTTIKNPYYAMAFYANYLGLGGKTLNSFALYDYTQAAIQGFSFSFMDKGLRKNNSLNGLLSVDASSTKLNDAVWNLLPFRRRDGSYFTAANKGVEAGWTNTEVMRGENFNPNTAPNGVMNNGTRVTGLKDSHFFRLEMGPALIADALMVDMFSHELEGWSTFFWRYWYTDYVKVWQDNKKLTNDQADKRTWEHLKNSYKAYRNVVKHKASGKQYYTYTADKNSLFYGQNESSFHFGDYDLPLQQVMLGLWMSEKMGKTRNGNKLYGDPVQNFSITNHKHRYNNYKYAWNAMGQTFDVGTLLKNWKSITFVKYMPDAFNIKTGKMDVTKSRHRSTKRFKVSDPFADVKMTRKKLKEFSK